MATPAIIFEPDDVAYSLSQLGLDREGLVECICLADGQLGLCGITLSAFTRRFALHLRWRRKFPRWLWAGKTSLRLWTRTHRRLVSADHTKKRRQMMLRSRIAVISVIFLATAAFAQKVADEKSDHISAVPSPPGRYQIVSNPSVARDTFLLDTSTGRVWQLTQFGDIIGEPSAWDMIPRIDTDEDFNAFLTSHRLKPKKK